MVQRTQRVVFGPLFAGLCASPLVHEGHGKWARRGVVGPGSRDLITTEMRNVFSGTLLPLYVLELVRKDSKPKFQTFTTSCNHTYKYKLLMMISGIAIVRN